MVTELEIDTLKEDWIKDPCWDIEDTEGFEEHRDQLALFHERMIAQWEAERRQRSLDAAERVGMSGNARLGETINALVSRIEELEDRVDELSRNT